MKLESKSERGMLIEILVKNFAQENLFEPNDVVFERLQKKLNSNLKFKTKLFVSEANDDKISGEISFKTKEDKLRIMEFAIMKNNQ